MSNLKSPTPLTGGLEAMSCPHLRNFGGKVAVTAGHVAGSTAALAYERSRVSPCDHSLSA